MKKFLSLLFSLFLLGTSLVPASASARVPARVLTGARNLTVKSSELAQRIPALRLFRPSSQIILSGRNISNAVLAANNIRLPSSHTAPGSGASISASVQGAFSENVGIDVTSLTLTQEQGIDLMDNLRKQGVITSGLSLSDPVLSVAPHLWVERGFPRTPQQNEWALQNYRAHLNQTIDASAKQTRQRSQWSDQMAAAANLGFFGGPEDVPALLQTYASVPEPFKPYTEVIIGRAFLAMGDTNALTKLASLSQKDGELLGEFWAGVKQYAEETNLALELPPVKEGSVLPAMNPTGRDSLVRFNSLNALHANPGLDATREWLALNEKKGALLEETPAAQTSRPSGGRQQTAPSVPPQTIPPEVPAETTPTVEPQNPTSVVPPAPSGFTPPASFARGLFTTEQGREGGLLGVFCDAKGITFQGRPFEAIQEAAQYRDELVRMIERNANGILMQGIKGLNDIRLSTLSTKFPPSNNSGNVISRAAAEKIADLVLELANPAKAAQLLKMAPDGYIFLDYDNELTLSLKTERQLPSVPELAELIPSARQTDFIATFDASVGKTTHAEANTPDLNRYFHFKGFTPVTFEQLPAFLQRNPAAEFQQTTFKKKTVNTSGYGNPESIRPRQEKSSKDAELTALESLLKNEESGIVLFSKPTAVENLTDLNGLLQQLKQPVLNYLKETYPEANFSRFTVTVRMGEHEISSGMSAIALSNMHAHVETFIPAMNFGVTFTVPIRVSYTMKQDIIKQYEDWAEEGELGSSFLESFTPAAVQTPPPAQNVSRSARQTKSSAAADYDDMLPDGLIPVFAY